MAGRNSFKPSLYLVDLLYTHQEMPYGRPQFI